MNEIEMIFRNAFDLINSHKTLFISVMILPAYFTLIRSMCNIVRGSGSLWFNCIPADNKKHQVTLETLMS